MFPILIYYENKLNEVKKWREDFIGSSGIIELKLKELDLILEETNKTR